MVLTKVTLEEESIVKLILQFLNSRRLHKAARALEKEASVVNYPYSDNITFLRELLLDGEWEAVQEFAQPLEAIQDFDCRKFHFLVEKEKYLEILFQKCEGNVKDEETLRESLLSCLNLLEKYCPLREEYNKLYWYLSVSSLRNEPEFSNWNVDTSRMVLFEEIIELLKPFMPLNEKNGVSGANVAPADRLLGLISKGLLYENCIDFCQKQAMNKTNASDFSLTNIRTNLFQAQSPKSSGNFYSWLHSLSPESFVTPFEELNVEVQVEKRKHARASVDIKNNSLSRSLTFELTTPKKGSVQRSGKEERKRVSDVPYGTGQLDVNLRDVSQSWADFNFVVNSDEKRSNPVRARDNEVLVEEMAVAEPPILDVDSKIKDVESPMKLRRNQQELVLQRLEEHKKRQKELHQQLAEMTASLAKEDVKEAWVGKDPDVSNTINGVIPSEVSSAKSLEALRKSKESLRFLQEAYTSPRDSRTSSNSTPDAVMLKGKIDTSENNHSVAVQPVVSVRPTRISIPDDDNTWTGSSKSLSTPTSATLPKTPVNTVLPPCLVKLTDGSGAFNTSTPKSHRQAYMTPPPPASPVASEQTAAFEEIPLRQSHPDRVIQKETQKKSAVHNAVHQTPKARTASVTKQSAVRRSLVNDIAKEKDKDDTAVNDVSGEMNFRKIAALSDTQAIRSIAFHPSGKYFAIGTNSKALKVCCMRNLKHDAQTDRGNQDIPEPEVVYKKIPIHRGSVYCVAFSPKGDIIATGSNDKIIKVLRFGEDNLTGQQDEMELAIHNATVRDLTFVNTSGSLPVLASGGAGGGLIHLSDCWTGQTVSSLQGHAGNIMAVFGSSQSNLLCSGSADRSVRLWDLRVSKCIDVISTTSCVASVCFNYETDPVLIASAQENGQCMLYDLSARKSVTTFHPHNMDCRSIRFSPDSKYLLTGSYDASIAVTPVRYDTMIPQTVGRHKDKVIQCRWHPSQYTQDRKSVV